MERIKLLIVHPDRLYLELLGDFLSAQSQFLVLGRACCGKDLAQNLSLRSLAPAVILLSLIGEDEKNRFCVLSQESNLLRAIYPNAKLFVVGIETETEVIGCVRAGAAGYCFRSESPISLVEAIHSVAEGEVVIAPRVAGMLFSYLAEQPYFDLNLTPREKEVLQLIDKNLSNKEIACQLNISVQTVKNHIHNLLQKLKLDTRKEAVRYAKNIGLLQLK